jgi:hypothetical protein
VPGIVDVPGIEVWGRGRGEYTLPCGAVDEGGKVHKTVVLRELTGAEEDLMDDDDLSVTERTTRILSACCERIGEISDPATISGMIGDTLDRGYPVTSSDRIAMLIFLRRCSLGDNYKFERRCPRCGFMNKNKVLDLRKIEMVEVPEDRVGKRRVEIMLPRTKRKAILRVLTASKESAITTLRPNQKDLRSAAILARLEQIEEPSAVDQLARTLADPNAEPEPQPVPVGAPVGEAVGGEAAAKPAATQMLTLRNPRQGLDLVKALPQQDRNFLRQVYNKMEADVDTTVEVTCDSRLCGAPFSFPLDLGQSFFLSPETEHVSDEALNWL